MKIVASNSLRASHVLLHRVIPVFAVALSHSLALATTWYISTTGSDSNPGSTPTSPFATLSRAAQSAAAGDTIYLRAGTYYFTTNQPVACNGSPASPINISSYPGEVAVLDGSQTPASTNLITILGRYVSFSNLQVQNATRTGIVLHNASYITISNCSIHNSILGGICAYSSTIGGTSNLTISSNQVYANDQGNTNDPTGSGTWNPAIQLLCASNSIVSNNAVYSNYGEGIGICRSNIISVTGNTLYDDYSVDLYLDNATNTTCTQNMITATTAGTAFYKNGLPAIGIQAANETYTGFPNNPCNYDVICANIVSGTGEGFAYNTYGNGGGLKNFIVSNNTFYGTAGCMLFLPFDPGTNGTLISNNIFRQTGTAGTTYVPSITGITFMSNCWFGGWTSSVVAAKGDVYADPGFITSTPVVASDFSLSPSSPCTACATGTLTPYSFFGILTTTSPRLGAIAY